MKNILYLIHVHWGWIKQRPQFIAEHLSLRDDYSVSVFCESSYTKETLTKSDIPSSLNIHELSRLPFRRFTLIRWLNTQYYRFQLKESIAAAEIVWITYPYLFDWIKSGIRDRACLVYDCMDDALEAPDVVNDSRRRSVLIRLEAKIVRRADVIFASSDNLKEKLIRRYELKPEVIQVVNNAINIQSTENPNVQKSPGFSLIENELTSSSQINIMYLGTIGPWIDFDLIHKSLEMFPEVTYFFIGPKENTPKSHQRLLFFPPIPHTEVFKCMALADALIMPFEVSDFIRGVNPVKVYEYIYSCKPSIVVGYPETERFSQYVNLYYNEIEFLELIRRLVNGDIGLKSSKEEANTYVMENTWDSRVKSICGFLN